MKTTINGIEFEGTVQEMLHIVSAIQGESTLTTSHKKIMKQDTNRTPKNFVNKGKPFWNKTNIKKLKTRCRELEGTTNSAGELNNILAKEFNITSNAVRVQRSRHRLKYKGKTTLSKRQPIGHTSVNTYREFMKYKMKELHQQELTSEEVFKGAVNAWNEKKKNNSQEVSRSLKLLELIAKSNWERLQKNKYFYLILKEVRNWVDNVYLKEGYCRIIWKVMPNRECRKIINNSLNAGLEEQPGYFEHWQLQKDGMSVELLYEETI